jgi:hypothetical protein
MKVIKVLGVIVLSLLLSVMIGAGAWALNIAPSIWFLPASMIGVCIGLCAVKFIIDIIEG